MKSIIPILLLSLLLQSGFTQNFSGDKILGNWLSDNRQTIIEFFEDDGAYFGKMVWLKFPYDQNGEVKRDIKNPDRHLRDRFLLGMVCISDFIYAGNAFYSGGKGYSPDFGKYLKGTMRMLDENTLEVNVKIAFFTKTVLWTRIE